MLIKFLQPKRAVGLHVLILAWNVIVLRFLHSENDPSLIRVKFNGIVILVIPDFEKALFQIVFRLSGSLYQ